MKSRNGYLCAVVAASDKSNIGDYLGDEKYSSRLVCFAHHAKWQWTC